MTARFFYGVGAGVLIGMWLNHRAQPHVESIFLRQHASYSKLRRERNR
jgi:hypothetical protein